jgi:WD40 repeat protein
MGINRKDRTGRIASGLWIIVSAISLFLLGVPSPASANQSQTGAQDSFRLEPLWATQVDPRWHSGDSLGDIEDGITAEFVEFSADGRWLVTGNGLGEAFLLSAATGAVERRFSYITEQDIAGRTEFDISGGKTKGTEVECGAFTPDGHYLVLGGNLNGVKVFDLRDGSLLRHIKVEEEVDGLGISPDGRFLAHAAPRSAQVRRLPDWDLVASIRHGEKRGVTNSIDFTPDARLMVSAGNYGHVILTRTADWRQVGDGLIPKTSSIKSVRFSPDTDLVAAGYGGADCVAVYRTKDMFLLKHLPLFYIEAAAWTSDGRFLMAGGRDERGCMRVFRTSDWQLVGAPEVQADRSNIEYIDVCGNLVAVAGEDAHVRLYRVASSEGPLRQVP